MEKREYAKKVLVHYIKHAWEAAGKRWDNDNRVEVEGIVDDIIEAAKQELREEAASSGVNGKQ